MVLEYYLGSQIPKLNLSEKNNKIPIKKIFCVFLHTKYFQVFENLFLIFPVIVYNFYRFIDLYFL